MIVTQKGGSILSEKILLLNEIETVRTFVSQSMVQTFDIDIVSGKYTVNAKSIMGIFSLDLTKPVKLIADCDENHPFIKFCEQYEVETK